MTLSSEQIIGQIFEGVDEKSLAAFCVGGSPIENPDIDQFLKNNFSEDEQKKVKIFYCPGGFNYDKMSKPSKMMMNMFVKALIRILS